MKAPVKFAFLTLLIAAAIIAPPGCSSGRGKNSESVQAESSPAESNALRTAPNTGLHTIAGVDTAAKVTYESGKAGDWKMVSQHFAHLRQAADDLQRSDLKTQVEQTVASLAGAIADKDMMRTMKESNRITSLAAELNAEY